MRFEIHVFSKTRVVNTFREREKGRRLTQYYGKSPVHPQKKSNVTIQKRHLKLITQRLRTDLGRSVGVTTVNQLV